MSELIERLREVARDEDERVRLVIIASGLEPIRYTGSKTGELMREAAAALEAAREDACVALVADIRFACGDHGKRMQPELVEFIRGLAADAAKWRESGAGK